MNKIKETTIAQLPFFNLPITIYQLLFLIGLAFEVAGQVLLAQGNDYVYALKPIDFAHWSLLLGVVLLLPQLMSSPNKIWSYIGIPTALVGIVCIIGMCVLDFIWWSQPTQEIRVEFAGHLSQFPSIWKPFITSGPKFLNIGLFFISLNYIKNHKIAVSIIIFTTALFLNLFPFPYKMIFGYLFTLLGFSLIFFGKRPN